MRKFYVLPVILGSKDEFLVFGTKQSALDFKRFLLLFRNIRNTGCEVPDTVKYYVCHEHFPILVFKSSLEYIPCLMFEEFDKTIFWRMLGIIIEKITGKKLSDGWALELKYRRIWDCKTEYGFRFHFDRLPKQRKITKTRAA